MGCLVTSIQPSQVLVNLESQQPRPCSPNVDAESAVETSLQKWVTRPRRAHLTLQITAFFISSPVIFVGCFSETCIASSV